jgi:tRNA (adenine37-N6)-methyltransferase
MQVTLESVGTVRSPYDDQAERDWTEVESEIHLDESLVEGLKGIDRYTHIIIVFYLHKFVFDRERDLIQPCYEADDAPCLGVFALRTNQRPNAIGSTTVRLLRVDGHILHVKGLDAFDGSPVLDIKPYTPPVVNRDIVLPDFKEPEI